VVLNTSRARGVAEHSASKMRVNALSPAAPDCEGTEPDDQGDRDEPGHDKIEKWFKTSADRSDNRSDKKRLQISF
jgi:hypothetical protein